MNAANFSAENGHGKRPALANGYELPLLLLLFCIPPLIGMARHPFWLDEVFTLFPAPNDDSSLRAAFASAFHFSGSVQFTPLHTFLVAIWARIVPPTEFALRCMNLPFLIGIALISRALLRRLALRSMGAHWLVLTFIALSPFYLYYSYDLRPYASLICFGGMMLLGLLLWGEWQKSGPWLIATGFSLAFLTQPTVLLLAPVILAGVIVPAWRDPRRAIRMWIAPGIIGTIATGAGGFYYHLVRSGGGMNFWGGGGFLKNIVFVLYEFMGFGGVGPTRSQLRALAPPTGVESTLAPVHLASADWLPAIVLALLWGAVAGIVVYATFRVGFQRFWSIPLLRLSAILFFAGLLLLNIFFNLIDYRFQARHASFLYLPFLFLVIASMVQSTGKWTTRFTFLALLVVMGLSSGRLLFDPVYMREDPRGLVRAWREVNSTEGPADLWAFYPPESMIYYVKGTDLLVLSDSAAYRCDRIGPATYRKTELPDALVQNGFGTEHVISIMRLKRRELWQHLLESHRGKMVVIAVNRGTEFDPENFARELIDNPAAQAKKIGEWPFVEAYKCVVP